MKGNGKKIVKRKTAGAYLSSVVSISLVLLLFGVASLLLANAKSVADYFKESLQITVLLKQGVKEDAAEKYRKEIAELPYVKDTRLVSREEGTQELKEMLGEDFLSVFESSPVPVSIDVSLHSDYVSSDSVAVVRKALEKSSLVDEVEYRQNLIDALNSNLAKISVVIAVFIALLLFISVVLIANMVRMDAFNHRFTIHAMQLVGATQWFICRPFVLRAVVQGLESAVLAILMLGAALFAVRDAFSQLAALFSVGMLVKVSLGVIFAGIIICTVSTYFIVKKITVLDKEELYG